MELRPVKFVDYRNLQFCFLLFCALAALTPQTFAQGGVPLWTNLYSELPNGYNEANAIVADTAGNVFVTGSSSGTNGYRDFATLAYSNTGIPLWTNRYDGPASSVDEALSVAIDSSNNVFVTGQSIGNNRHDFATIKYSNSGIPLWTNRYSSLALSDYARALVVGTNGNVYVTGTASLVEANSDYVTIAYSNTGVPLWTNRFNGQGDYLDDAFAIAVDNSGIVFVTGRSFGSGSLYDFATIAYSSAGVPLWTNFCNGPANDSDEAVALATDKDGNVIVTGYSYGTNGWKDYAIVKYSSSGIPLWTNRYDGPASEHDQPSAIVIDQDGNVFVTGESAATNGYPDFATVAYSSTGTSLWTNRYNGMANDWDSALAMTLDKSGNVFVTGSSWNATNSDCATVAYSNSGIPMWTNLHNNAGSLGSYGTSIAADNAGNVFVAGSSRSSSGKGYQYTTIKYSSSIPPVHLNFHLLNNELVLSWTNGGFSLQTAPASTGTFTNLPGATSPYTNSLTAAQQFFRLKKN